NDVTLTRVPVANPQSVTTQQNVALPITLTGSNDDGDPLTFNIAAQPARGTLSGPPPNVTYTPAPPTFGTDSFTFTVADGSIVSNPATVSITITPTNTPPSFTPGGNPTVAEDSVPYSAAWTTNISP